MSEAIIIYILIIILVKGLYSNTPPNTMEVWITNSQKGASSASWNECNGSNCLVA